MRMYDSRRVNNDLKGGMVGRSPLYACCSIITKYRGRAYKFAAMVPQYHNCGPIFGMAFLIGFRPSAGGTLGS